MGKRVVTTVPSDRPKKEALVVAQAMEDNERSIRLGTDTNDRIIAVAQRAAADRLAMNPGKGRTFEVVAEEFIKAKRVNVKKRTVINWEVSFKNFSRFLMKIGKASSPVHDITGNDAQDWVIQLSENCEPSTAAAWFIRLRQLFTWELDKGLLVRSPFAGIDKPKVPKKKTAPPVFRDDVWKLLDAANVEHWKRCIIVGYYTGLRIGDASTLEWSEMDLAAGMLKLWPNKQEKGYETELVAPIHDVLWKLLKEWKAEAAGDRQWVIPFAAKTYIRNDTGVTGAMNRIFTRAKIGTTFHGLRSGFITQLSQKGVGVEVAAQLTHHSLKDVHFAYVHTKPEDMRVHVNKIESLG